MQPVRSPATPGSDLLGDARDLARREQFEEALELYRTAAGESPTAATCIEIARCYERIGERREAYRWALRTAGAPAGDFTAWQAAVGMVRRLADAAEPAPRRSARLALLGSYTTTQLASMLRLAALAVGVELEIAECPYGQYRQEILDPGSATYAFDPNIALLAVHAGELGLPAYSAQPEDAVAVEVDRWTSLWTTLGKRSAATVVQHLFALPLETAFGHLGATLPGARETMARAVNARLAASAPDHVAVVDCERLASWVGKRRWFDARYWHLAKQAVALDALPVLCSHTAAVVAARLGLGKKCLVVDLDNTLWGGVIGEDGLAGIELGDTPAGEAFQAFQDLVAMLKRRGLVIAVCSKNNDADAREVFDRHPGMRLRLDDIAVFVADWRSKPDQIRTVAETLDLALDSFVFVDDNPAEREAVRRLLPEVDVVVLPPDPAGYVEALNDYALLEPASFTREDASRTEHYHARRQAAASAESASSLEDFYRDLQMEAVVSPFTDEDLPRISQLVGKTNQFNATTRRHSAAALRALASSPGNVHLALRLKDRFADHGLVGVLIAVRDADVLEIDTWLMSCRVIGRTAENALFQVVFDEAAAAGCTAIRGVYIPTPKNGLVADLFDRLGFELLRNDGGTTEWSYDLARHGRPANDFIRVVRQEGRSDVAA